MTLVAVSAEPVGEVEEAEEEEPAPQLRIRPWPDPVLDRVGHDPRSSYCESFWLPTLGPASLLFARQVVAELDREPDGFDISVPDAAHGLGLGVPKGRKAALYRALDRLVRFGFAHVDPPIPQRLFAADLAFDRRVLLRRRFPGLTRGQVNRLPSRARRDHDELRAAERVAPAHPAVRERGRLMALTLLELEEPPAEVAAHLERLGFDAAVARQSVLWARAHQPVTSR